MEYSVNRINELVFNSIKPVKVDAPVPVVPIVNAPAAMQILAPAVSSRGPASPPAVMPAAPVSAENPLKWLLIAGGIFLIYQLGRAK